MGSTSWGPASGSLRLDVVPRRRDQLGRNPDIVRACDHLLLFVGGSPVTQHNTLPIWHAPKCRHLMPSPTLSFPPCPPAFPGLCQARSQAPRREGVRTAPGGKLVSWGPKLEPDTGRKWPLPAGSGCRRGVTTRLIPSQLLRGVGLARRRVLGVGSGRVFQRLRRRRRTARSKATASDRSCSRPR